jgi:hypothetical protein
MEQIRHISFKYIADVYQTVESWSKLLEAAQSAGISLNNILEFSLVIPGTFAATEGVFSVTNTAWTDEKNRFLVDTFKAVIVKITHFRGISCWFQPASNY